MSVHCAAGVGAMPAGIGVQVPTVPARLQARQVAAQPVLQQTPCWQKPDLHIAADVHAVPFSSWVQTLPMQLKPATQSAAVAQLVLQFVVPQTYGLHERSIPGAQAPAASHRPATRSAPAVHISIPHTVLTAYLRHAPMPLHMPSSPQVVTPSSPHSPFGSWPSGTLRQVPSLPPIAHDRQVPVQVVPQHLPCAQIMEKHSSLMPQVAPIGFLPQLPATQLLGATQSASDVHVVRHVFPSGAHWNGVQGCVVAPEHPPALSQVPVVVRMNPTQASAAHTTPALPL
jgi:hypothetical protein